MQRLQLPRREASRALIVNRRASPFPLTSLAGKYFGGRAIDGARNIGKPDLVSRVMASHTNRDMFLQLTWEVVQLLAVPPYLVGLYYVPFEGGRETTSGCDAFDCSTYPSGFVRRPILLLKHCDLGMGTVVALVQSMRSAGLCVMMRMGPQSLEDS